MVDPIDEYTVQQFNEPDGTKLKSTFSADATGDLQDTTSTCDEVFSVV